MNFEEVYNQNFKDVYLYILRLSGNKEVAEDVTSETFFKAMKSIDSFRGECSLYSWLCQIAKNCYYSYVKKNSKYATIEDESLSMVVDERPGVDEVIMDSIEAQRIKKHLHKLSDPYKEVFMWRVFADMSFEQIGDLYGKTANWACVTYHRARKMLVEKMEENS